MSFEISDVSKTEKNVKFTIDKSEVLKNYSEIVKLFQKDADLKGFRKGKVPINVVESIYSEQINEELKTRLINGHLRGLAVEQKINIVTTKDLEHEGVNKDADFKFSLNFEFIPEINSKSNYNISKWKFSKTRNPSKNFKKSAIHNLLRWFN